MISAAGLWAVSCMTAGVALAACAAAKVTLRLLAARRVAAILAVAAAMTAAVTLAGAAVLAREMLISREDLLVVLAGTVTGALAGFGVSWVAGRRIAAACGLVLAAVRELGDTGLYRAPPAVLPAELAGLSEELVTAHGRLAAARDRERTGEASRRELTARVSRDLRAPLAALAATAAALGDGAVTGQEAAGYHTRIREQAARLAEMIDDLFELTRIEAGALRLARRPVGLGDLIGEALTSAGAAARARGVELRGAAAASPPVLADAAAAGRALRALMISAIRHAPPGGSVEVLGGEEPGMATIRVSGSCRAIPAGGLPGAPEAASRCDAGTATPGGGGLGLSIARGIIEAHYGQIDVHSEGAGCQFVIRLPLTPRTGGPSPAAPAPRPDLAQSAAAVSGHTGPSARLHHSLPCPPSQTSAKSGSPTRPDRRLHP